MEIVQSIPFCPSSLFPFSNAVPPDTEYILVRENHLSTIYILLLYYKELTTCTQIFVGGDYIRNEQIRNNFTIMTIDSYCGQTIENGVKKCKCERLCERARDEERENEIKEI